MITGNPNLVAMLNDYKLTHLLTTEGRASLPVFQVLRGRPNLQVKNTTEDEITRVTRFLRNRAIAPILKQVIRLRLHINASIPANDLFPTNGYQVKRMSLLKSSEIKDSYVNEAENLICDYKSGMLLTPGEVRHWSGKLRKLTSTKHKCAILRVAHGDIYTNDRLVRFGLANDSRCLSCDNQNETLVHRLVECPIARESWVKLEEQIEYMGLQTLTSITLENILGAGPDSDPSKLELTLRAELLSRIMSKCNGPYSAVATVKASLNTIRVVERLDKPMRDKLEAAARSL